jgi:hypothetical protein
VLFERGDGCEPTPRFFCLEKKMNAKYKRLIELAEELNTPSTSEKIKELNLLLAQIDINIVGEKHYHLLDDLITILHNTNNIFEETYPNIIELQDAIRRFR